MSVTNGSGSYSTSSRPAASSAMSSSSAATAATSSPTNRASVSSIGRSGAILPSETSNGVTTAWTPANRSAADASIETMRA